MGTGEEREDRTIAATGWTVQPGSVMVRALDLRLKRPRVRLPVVPLSVSKPWASCSHTRASVTSSIIQHRIDAFEMKGLRKILITVFLVKSKKNEKTRLDAFEMKGQRKFPRLSWTAKKTNKCVLNKAGVKRELLDTVKTRIWSKQCYGHTTRKLPASWSCSILR